MWKIMWCLRLAREGIHEFVGDEEDVLLVELDAHLVVAGLADDVGNAARAVLAVVEVDLGLARALDGDGQPAGARLARPDAELGCGGAKEEKLIARSEEIRLRFG